ncbi:putative hemagglutinin-related protein [Granulicella sibirica]|uniref:Putative hemagglutinin-related protein n=1 Tax=Granulicella sibirica TaxID=2479048 RepID=A0A4V1L5L9_9BACT|nr:putative hemagglutinin-related protein [Granulicella sibirica]
MFSVVALMIAPFGISGCGNFFVPPTSTSGGGSGTTTTSFAYVANATTSTISGFALASGSLVGVTNSPYSLPIPPTSLVVTPANSFLYVGSLGALYGYSIATDGSLTALSSGAALAAVGAVSLDVSPDGNWLFALDSNGVTVDEFGINTSTGALTPENGANFAVTGSGATSPRMIKVAPSGTLVFAAMGTGGEAVFTFNTTTGALVLSQTLDGSTVTSDNAITVDSTSTHLYIARSGTGTGIAVYTIGTAGALNSISGSPFAAGAGPYSVVINSAGTYLYSANRTDGTISGYAIGTTGALTALGTSPYASGSLVTALGRDSLGKYIVAASLGGSPDLTMYSFDATSLGMLDSVSTAATGTDPTGATAIAMSH